MRTFRWNIWPPSPGPKNKPSFPPASACFCDMFFRNVRRVEISNKNY
jgi:hypothetical protein